MAVNKELVLLYWQIGHEILIRQERSGWGAKIVNQLSADLKTAFPEMQGFSPRNLKYMRAFAAAWQDFQIVQEVLAQLPWYHHLTLLDKLSNNDNRMVYARLAVENGWSRNMMLHHIELGTAKRIGKAQNNFADFLPPAESELAAESLKDPYKGDDSATPLIPDETNKLTEQLAQLPDIPEKTQLTERLQRIMGKI